VTRENCLGRTTVLSIISCLIWSSVKRDHQVGAVLVTPHVDSFPLTARSDTGPLCVISNVKNTFVLLAKASPLSIMKSLLNLQVRSQGS
jgi:hypothetical protein